MATSEEQQILRLQERFDTAELDDDRKVLDELIAEDFQSIGPRGFVLDKEQWINRHDHFRYAALETSEHEVRLYGGAAIVRNVQRNTGAHDGQESQYVMRVGQTWVNQLGQWRLAGIQFSPLAQ
ncbi:MAG TPA: nuclear transport factor 2 family protein [Propionibacteriaceae bacterium]